MRNDVPCKNCIVFIMCKNRVHNMFTHSLLILANEIKCQELQEFFVDQKALNRVLSLFELPIYTF